MVVVAGVAVGAVQLAAAELCLREEEVLQGALRLLGMDHREPLSGVAVGKGKERDDEEVECEEQKMSFLMALMAHAGSHDTSILPVKEGAAQWSSYNFKESACSG